MKNNFIIISAAVKGKYTKNKKNLLEIYYFKKKMEAKKKYTRHQEFNKATFTHFISVPLIEASLKGRLWELQQKILSCFPKDQQKLLNLNNPDLFHITLSMLCLPKEEHKGKANEILIKNQELITKILGFSKLTLKLGKVLTFERQDKKEGKKYSKPDPKKQNSQKIIYLEVQEDENLKKLMQVSHVLIKDFIENEIIDTKDLKSMKVLYDHTNGCFRAETFHITLFRVDESVDLGGVKKELENFEFGAVDCNSIDISTRFSYDIEKFYTPLSRITF